MMLIVNWKHKTHVYAVTDRRMAYSVGILAGYNEYILKTRLH